MLNFKRNDIKNETDTGSYQRGFRYFKQGMVVSLKARPLNDNAVSLSSEVEGSGYACYEQTILVNKTRGRIDINGQCDCPVGFNCKHVVASCLEYLSRNPGGTSISTDDSLEWLSDFVTAGASATSYSPATGNEFISYALQPSNTGAELSVRILINRYLKKGGLGKGRRIALYNITNNYTDPDYLQDIDIDIEIALIIETLNESSWDDDELLLSADLGALALSKMLNTGRCHWLSPQNPVLQMGEPRDLQLNWQNQADGNHVLNITVQPEARVLNTQPALYVDSNSNEIGEIKGADFNAKQWAMLLEMPPIPVESCAQFSQQLLIACPDTVIPPPLKIDNIQIVEAIVPRLFLYGTVNPVNGYRAHFMRLRYCYGDYEVRAIPGLPVSSFMQDNKAISIHRDLMAEKSSLDKLVNEGFQAMPDESQGDMIFVTAPGSDHARPAVRWQNFLQKTLPQLETQGWEIEMDASFQLEFLQVDDWDVEVESDNDWFDLRFDLEIEGKKIQLLPLIAEVLSSHKLDNLPETILLPLANHMDGNTGNSKYLQIPTERIRPIFQTLYELFNTESIDENGKLRLSRFDATRLAELEDNCSNELKWRGGKAMRQLGRKLKSFKGIKKVAPPRGLTATLRDYQKQGLNWLQFLREFGFNGILADDMGLGKTVQTLAHLLKEKEAERLDKPCLMVAPTSLMSNWRREAERFTPDYASRFAGCGTQRFADMKQYDLLLTTYPLLVRDRARLQVQYHSVILDEAQAIKNHRAKMSQLVRQLDAGHRLCLTGTPLENHLGELWALFDFLMPGFLGDPSFTRFLPYAHRKTRRMKRIASGNYPALRLSCYDALNQQVMAELPAKTEIIRAGAQGTQRGRCMKAFGWRWRQRYASAIKQKGLSRSHIMILGCTAEVTPDLL